MLKRCLKTTLRATKSRSKTCNRLNFRTKALNKGLLGVQNFGSAMNIIRIKTLAVIIDTIVNYYYNLPLFDHNLLKFSAQKPITNTEQKANLAFFKIAADAG